jgi:hypothetical protein
VGLIDNLNFLRKNYPHIWSQHNFSSLEESSAADCFQIVDAHNQLPTLLYIDGSQKFYIHSKYDPLREGQQLISKYENIAEYDHVFFYGIGLGYHIEEFIKKYPDKEFSIYEPSAEIFLKYLKAKEVKTIFNAVQLRGTYIEKTAEESSSLLNEFMSLHANKKVLLIFLPSYERVYQERFREFNRLFQRIVTEKRLSFHVEAAYQKHWIVNSLLNFPQVVKTPNVLHDLDKEKFKNKPALLVAAGPSLQEDIEYIRKIKKQGLAYVFSVGSAISILINNGIYPDAACTYDPSPKNHKVFEKVVREGITEIPLIFGSSVGFETLQHYPGKMAHMITSQDTLSPFLLKRSPEGPLDTVLDSPSIAVVTLQMLLKLEFSPIILAGQNLAYRDQKRYAQGIEQYDQNNTLSQKEIEEALRVEDVYGQMILTDESFNRMRQQMELHISQFPGAEIINTTKGGARIQGTVFKPLAELMQARLQAKIVEDNWLQADNHYQRDYLQEKLAVLESEKEKLLQALNEMTEVFKELDHAIKTADSQKAAKSFPKFDKVFAKISKNLFYRIFLLPMNRVHFEIMANQKRDIRFVADEILKAEKVLEEIGKFVYVCRKDFEGMIPLWQGIFQALRQNEPGNTAG